MLAETTITVPTNFNMPDFQPLWAWIAAAVSLWYVGVAVLMRLTGRGRRISEKAEMRNKIAKASGWHDLEKDKPEIGVLCYLDYGSPDVNAVFGPGTWNGEVFLGGAGQPFVPSSQSGHKNWNRWRYVDKPKTRPISIPPEVVVFGRLLISPLEFLVWLPTKYVALAAFSPFVALTWIAKGSNIKNPNPQHPSF